MERTNNKAIIGLGVVGKSTSYILGINRYVDKWAYKNCNWNFRKEAEEIAKTDIFILCLPTPTNEDGTQDLSAIEEWLRTINTYCCVQYPYPIVIIRSTVLPGTTKEYAERFKKLNFVHIPEFLSGITAFEDAKNPELLVIGTDDPLVKQKVKDLFASSHMEAKTAIFCDPTTAEMVKYTMNSFFALKVVLGNQLWDACRKTGADYKALKNALEAHKWGSKNGWDVWHGGYRGYGGKCLKKDVKAFVSTFDLPLLKVMQKINEELIKKTL